MTDFQEGDGSAESLSGMTVNERLFACALLDQWDKAVGQRDKPKMVSILRQVAFAPGDEEIIACTVPANPVKYGFAGS